MGFTNKVVAEKCSVLDDVLNPVVKDLDSSSNAELCIIKLLYGLFVKQGQPKRAVGIDASKGF